mmetsp:Transcript_54788/g.90868  ORF Transcript_54788/g.90868 Transcript_54788/m.90868 type:complete len:217 (+) Transcript_54788:27-677(+)|eukprot:CAMPEP_0202720296 /NCGR_PEP_ID=MMETSP1385-20130828/138754_1 /ASSEMBLY_ACC=CAM_ASM_000861 /TAXON_ID=933848 /ORGANISM="Elphidium margaritaceum" /LENGTH=216 /DNA_ID=CAMNT_0049383939 /DNA_START=33 /DNA_END=683 /DNA_ORIENTATION=-
MAQTDALPNDTDFEGKSADESVDLLRQTILFAFGEQDGKALITSIQQDPSSFVSDKRPIAAEYAKRLLGAQSSEVVIAQLMRQMNQLRARLDALESGANEKPLQVSLGKFKYREKTEYVIPNDVPDGCKKILLYVTFQSGSSSRDIHPDITISVTARHNETYTHHLLAHTYNQDAWSYNSDNFWMPMPKDRKLIITQSKQYGGNAWGSVQILRYTV